MTNSTECAIIKIQKRSRKATAKSRSPRERCKTFPFQFRLIASTPRCVGLGDTNVNQSRLAEEMTDYAYYKATKKKSRIFKKGLDKYHRMWYNDYSQEGNLDGESHQGQWKQTRSELKPKGYTIASSPRRAWQRPMRGEGRLRAGPATKLRSGRVSEIMKKVANFFRKPLDKSNPMWYN